jgi:HK97 family phage portal protein
MSLVPKIKLPSAEIVRSAPAEGAFRPGPYLVGTGWLPASWGHINFWQNGRSPIPYTPNNAMVEACISAYAQTVSMCPGDHWRANSNGGRDRISTQESSLARCIRRPNQYESITDFLNSSVRFLYTDGNAYALALRNGRGEVEQLHLMDPSKSSARVAENGDIFYYLSGNEIVDRIFAAGGARSDILNFVPARDVLHIRMHTGRNRLKGETPLMAAAMSLAMSNTIVAQQLTFFQNQARPSFILSSDLKITEAQAREARAIWDEQTKGLNQGGTPIMFAGLKPYPLSSSGDQAHLAEILKYSDDDVALALRIPLQVIGRGPTPFASTEALMQNWKNGGGLGPLLNHIEESIGNFFGLRGQPEEYLEFDTSALMRSSEVEYIRARKEAVSGGIETINEARAKLSLPRVDGGDDIRVQQQDVPLDWAEKQQTMLEAKNRQQSVAPAPRTEPREGNSNGAESREVSRSLAADILNRSGIEFERHIA